MAAVESGAGERGDVNGVGVDDVNGVDDTRVDPVRVLVVWYPDWPIVATGGLAEPGRAVAVVAGDRVLACSDAARLAGVRRGQRLRLAHRLCPELRLRERDPAGETRCFEPVVAAVEAFTPRVEVLRPGLCAIQVKGPARYFGGERALVAAVSAALAGLRVAVDPAADRATDWGGPVEPAPVTAAAPGSTGAPAPRLGAADGVFAAVLAARAGVVVPAGRTAEFLAPYPVAALEDEPLAELLVRLGVPTLGDFARLPAATVADRFGPAGRAAHRLAQGRTARPPAGRTPGPSWRSSSASTRPNCWSSRWSSSAARSPSACTRRWPGPGWPAAGWPWR